eukprot:g243.t1
MSQGFGICGHKNNFSTKILCGNWVEDRIGAQLVQDRPEPRDQLTTDTRANFIAPAEMGDKQTANCPELNEVEAEATRQGLSYDVMFGHGKATESGGKQDPARYCSVETLMMSTRTDSEKILKARDGQLAAPVANDLAREKAKARAQAQRGMYQTTSQRAQSGAAGAPPRDASFASDSSFTKEFVRGTHVRR